MANELERKDFEFGIHLWNVKLGGIGHFPTLPNLKPEEGFAPIKDYLRIIREEN